MLVILIIGCILLSLRAINTFYKPTKTHLFLFGYIRNFYYWIFPDPDPEKNDEDKLKILFGFLNVNNTDSNTAIVLETLKELGVSYSEFEQQINNNRDFRVALAASLNKESEHDPRRIIAIFLMSMK
jgi:hypothetical protein